MLYEFNITHFLSLGPVEVTSVPVIHHRIDIPPDAPDELLFALPDACTFIRDALANGGKVLVHSLLETRACTVVAAHRKRLISATTELNQKLTVMTERNISSVAATKVIQDGQSVVKLLNCFGQLFNQPCRSSTPHATSHVHFPSSTNLISNQP